MLTSFSCRGDKRFGSRRLRGPRVSVESLLLGALVLCYGGGVQCDLLVAAEGLPGLRLFLLARLDSLWPQIASNLQVKTQEEVR